jgi:hypothetical protein
MVALTSVRVFIGTLLISVGITGCASEFTVVGTSGEPLLISRRGFTPAECTALVKGDAAHMGLTLRYIHIRGNTVGRSLLWPFEPGYACEGGVGPEQGPTGTYLQTLHILRRGS